MRSVESTRAGDRSISDQFSEMRRWLDIVRVVDAGRTSIALDEVGTHFLMRVRAPNPAFVFLRVRVAINRRHPIAEGNER
jgi:hypothetical protein